MYPDNVDKRQIRDLCGNKDDNNKKKFECQVCHTFNEKIYYSTLENLLRCDLSKDCNLNEVNQSNN